MKLSKCIVLIVVVVIAGCSHKTVQKKRKLSKLSKEEVSFQGTKQPLHNQKIVIEGTVISSRRHFYNSTIYSSCLVEINTIFSGNIEEKVIEVCAEGGSIQDLGSFLSHGQITLPLENSTAIFRIKEVQDNCLTKAFKDLTPFKLFHAIEIQNSLSFMSNFRRKTTHIEKDIYQKLGSKRRKVIAPATTDEVAIDYSLRNRYLLPNRKKGLIYKLIPIVDREKSDYIGFHIMLTSSNSVAYLKQGELIINYSPECFGDSIVSKGSLIYEIPRNTKKGRSFRSNSIPPHFEVKCIDNSANSIKIEWLNNYSVDSCLQLLPTSIGIHAASIYFLPKKMNISVNLKLNGKASMNLHYDYEMNQVVPFEYVATEKQLYYRASAIIAPTITDIIPNKTFEPLDTVQIIGKNFGSDIDISIHTKGTGIYYRRKKIPASYILNKSDSLITMIIPTIILTENAHQVTEEWFPTDGAIVLIKRYGDNELIASSKKALRIKKRVIENIDK